MATLLIEPFGGMAGDMLLAALLDLGDPRFGLADLRALADELVPGECELLLTDTRRGGLAGKLLEVRTAESHHPPHRHYADLEHIVGGAALSDTARARALAALWRIAVAEGRVHGRAPEEIHFHEVGAVDTLVDVCGAALALDRLEVERVLAAPPLVGEGTVRCAHGEMPVPTPAVAEILRGRPLVHGGGPGERLTPTAAALLREWVEDFEPPGAFTASAVGYGAGRRDPDTGPPNLVRVQLGQAAAERGRRAEAWQLELNLDDLTGEELAFLAEGLRDAGALDVWTTPVHMKKHRPGVVVGALCRAGRRDALESVVFERSSTLGLRWWRVERRECEREELTIDLEGRQLRVKLRHRPGADAPGARDLSPEHDDLAQLARDTGASLRELERQAVAAAWELLSARESRGS